MLECNCGSTLSYYKNGKEVIIHYEDCILIQSQLGLLEYL